MKIGIACDHRGLNVKDKVIKYLTKKGYEIVNYGTDTLESVDYPDYAFKVGKSVVKNEVDLGILICGTGIGMSIACNKVKGVRCAKVDTMLEAKYAKYHNNANVIALASTLSTIKIKDIMDAFLTTEFSNDERHNERNKKIDNYR